MCKYIISVVRWFSNKLNEWANKLENKNDGVSTKFVDLAPVDDADNNGIYSEALHFATNDPKVFNIALTGPYGSGKSSIIQSFLKTYRQPPLHISLAAFIAESENKAATGSRQEIERSILQQMLYGADANKLPLSRFKRIQSPGLFSCFNSLFILFGIISLWYVFKQQATIIDGSFFSVLSTGIWSKSGAVNLFICAFSLVFLWRVLHHFYVASFGLSLKGISLKDVEIKTASSDDSSILNRHLDEIIYFFQRTKYDLVIIEDLDRFDNAEIFVTLREINSLINNNVSVKRRIRFLYALRDDMFISTERTKFFEFIIPVIPIINSSNSIDMVLKQGTRLALDKRLNSQFIREVSRYLNDLRLIQNIFNEYSIYMRELDKEDENILDANKLLAVLIYKNVYPRDFEQLHKGEGIFSSILNLHDDLIIQSEAKYREELAILEDKLNIAESQTPNDLKELRQIYIMALLEIIPKNVHSVNIVSNRAISIRDLLDNEKFEEIINAQLIYGWNNNGHVTRFDISKLQNNVNPRHTYFQRKSEIENKSKNSKAEHLKRIGWLRNKLGSLRSNKLSEHLKLDNNDLNTLFESFRDNGDLARFLLLEGYLDDTYYQYTSLFHSGRLSPNDNKFLIKIRAFTTPEPDFQIDNPNEVIAGMRNEDFGQSYILNNILVDTLLTESNRYQDQLERLCGLVQNEFSNCEQFFISYYSSGRNVSKLLQLLARKWNGLVSTELSSPNRLLHITQLIGGLSIDFLKTLSKNNEDLTNFVADNLPEILITHPTLEPERFVALNFNVKNFEEITGNHHLVNEMFENRRFELSVANLDYVYQYILGGQEFNLLHVSNFTTIRKTKNRILISILENNFGNYLDNVLLELATNIKEDVSSILYIISFDDIDPVKIQKFIEQQTTELPTLTGVPERWKSEVFKLALIKPKWENCLDYMNYKAYDAEVLIEYLNRTNICDEILEDPISYESDLMPIFLLIINSNSMSSDVYQKYVKSIPLTLNEFPSNISIEKLRILIDESKIEFTISSLEQLEDESLQVLFIVNNIDLFLSEPEEFALTNDSLLKVMKSNISDENKIKMINLLDIKLLVNELDCCEFIGEMIINSREELPNIDAAVVDVLVKNSSQVSVQIKLLNKFSSLLSANEVRNILIDLPRPYSEITTGYQKPTLKYTSENIELATWLQSRKIISSSKMDESSKEITIFLFRK